MANSYIRQGGLWRAVGDIVVDPGPGPDPDPDPAPASWQEAVDSRSFAAVEAWYAANTGHEALGISASELASGSMVTSSHGQVIEGFTGSHIRIAHNDVTIRGCRVVSGSVYGAYLNPTFTATVTGCVIEYCTFVYPGEMVVEADAKSAAYILPAATTPISVTIRNCNMYRWGGGVRIANRCVFEYNWFHDMQHPPEVHANAVRAVSSGGRVRRNYLTDGRSGVASIYFDKEPTHDIIYEENILDGSSPGASPSYLMNFKDGDYGPGATNIKILNNMFGPEYQFGIYADANVQWNSNGNVRSGNQHFLTGIPVANS